MIRSVYPFPTWSPLGIFLCGFSRSAMTFTQYNWFILILPMLSGLGSSLFHPEAARLVNAISGTQNGKAMGTFFHSSNADFAVYPMAAGFSAYYFGIMGLIIYSVISFFIALFLMKEFPAIKARLTAAGKRKQPKKDPDWYHVQPGSFLIVIKSYFG